MPLLKSPLHYRHLHLASFPPIRGNILCGCLLKSKVISMKQQTSHYWTQDEQYFTLSGNLTQPISVNDGVQGDISKIIVNKSTRRAQTSAKANLVQIRSPLDPDFGSRRLPKCNGEFLVQSYICGKIFNQIRSVCQEIWAKLWQMPYPADEFHNLISSSLDRWLPVFNVWWRLLFNCDL